MVKVAVVENVISEERRAILKKIALKIHLEEGALSPLVGVVKAPIQVGRIPRIELHQCTGSIIAHFTKMILVHHALLRHVLLLDLGQNMRNG